MPYNPLGILILLGWIFAGVYTLDFLAARLGENVKERRLLNLAALLFGPLVLPYVWFTTRNQPEKNETQGDVPIAEVQSPRARKAAEREAAGSAFLDRDGNPVTPSSSRADSVKSTVAAAELVAKAIGRKAARIIVRPNHEGEYAASFRINGVEESVTRLETMVGGGLVAAFKHAGGIEHDDRRGNKNGFFSFLSGRKAHPCIVQTQNTSNGELLIVRLETLSSVPPLEALGLPGEELIGVKELIDGGKGLILLLGAPGSGTTTTYYSILEAAGLAGQNIVSIENPLELNIESSMQLEVAPAAGKSTLKLLSQAINDGADTLGIGLLNEPESARLAINSAKNGKLVVTVLDCATPLEALAKLEKWEITPRMLGGMPLVMLSQALARRNNGGGLIAAFSMPDRAMLEAVLATRGVTIDMIRGSIGAKIDGTGLEEQLEQLVQNGEITQEEAARVMRFVMRKGA